MLLQIIQILTFLWIQLYHVADCNFGVGKVTFTNLKGVKDTAKYTRSVQPAHCSIKVPVDDMTDSFEIGYGIEGEFQTCIPKRKKRFAVGKRIDEMQRLCAADADKVVVFLNDHDKKLVCCKNELNVKNNVAERSISYTNLKGEIETAMYTRSMTRAHCNIISRPEENYTSFEIGYMNKNGDFQSCIPKKQTTLPFPLKKSVINKVCEDEALETRLFLNDDSLVCCKTSDEIRKIIAERKQRKNKNSLSASSITLSSSSSSSSTVSENKF